MATAAFASINDELTDLVRDAVGQQTVMILDYIRDDGDEIPATLLLLRSAQTHHLRVPDPLQQRIEQAVGTLPGALATDLRSTLAATSAPLLDA